MKSSNDDNTERLNRIAEREIGRNPHSRGLIHAFLPVLITRSRFMEGSDTAASEPFEFDQAPFEDGIPLIGQRSLFYRNDPWLEMALALIPALKEGFPRLRNDLGKLEAFIQDGEIGLYDFFKERPETRNQVIRRWAADVGITPEQIDFLLGHVKRIVLERRRKALNGFVEKIDWEKGYCPICGAFPGIAVIEEKGGVRRLHCFQCGHEWRFSRVVCPWCEYRGEKGMTFFHVEGHDRESVFACEQCKRYLLTLNHEADLQERDTDLSAMGLAYLDLIMQEKGYLPMTACGWNIFSLPC